MSINYSPKIPFIPMSSLLQVSTGLWVRCNYNNSYSNRPRNALLYQGNSKSQSDFWSFVSTDAYKQLKVVLGNKTTSKRNA